MSCVSESRIPVGDWAKFNLELEKKIWGGGDNHCTCANIDCPETGNWRVRANFRVFSFIYAGSASSFSPDLRFPTRPYLQFLFPIRNKI